MVPLAKLDGRSLSLRPAAVVVCVCAIPSGVTPPEHLQPQCLVMGRSQNGSSYALPAKAAALITLVQLACTLGEPSDFGFASSLPCEAK